MKTVLPCVRWFRDGVFNTPSSRNYPCLPSTCDPSSRSAEQLRWLIPQGDATQMAERSRFWRDWVAASVRCARIDSVRIAADTDSPFLKLADPAADEPRFDPSPYCCSLRDFAGRSPDSR